MINILTTYSPFFNAKIPDKDRHRGIPDKGVIFEKSNGAKVYLGVYSLSDKVSVYEVYIRKTGDMGLKELIKLIKISLGIMKKGDIILAKSYNGINGKASRLLCLKLGYKIVIKTEEGTVSRLEIQ